tara:strand:- start:718 stop:891 length:174 start_codon:yes stop_codon:yes gene_type:complete
MQEKLLFHYAIDQDHHVFHHRMKQQSIENEGHLRAVRLAWQALAILGDKEGTKCPRN